MSEFEAKGDMDSAILNAANTNVPSVTYRVLNSPVFPAVIAGILCFVALVLIKPQFIQQEHSSAIALPKLNYGLIFAISFAVSVLVLTVPYFIIKN